MWTSVFMTRPLEKHLVGGSLYLGPDFRDRHLICFCSVLLEIFLTHTIQSANLTVSSLFFFYSERTTGT